MQSYITTAACNLHWKPEQRSLDIKFLVPRTDFLVSCLAMTKATFGNWFPRWCFSAHRQFFFSSAEAVGITMVDVSLQLVLGGSSFSLLQ